MEKFVVKVTQSASKDLEHYSQELQLNLLTSIRMLEISPFPKGDIIKKLRGYKAGNIYRLKMSGFRVIYRLEGRSAVVLAFVDRKDLEKKLKSMR